MTHDRKFGQANIKDSSNNPNLLDDRATTELENQEGGMMKRENKREVKRKSIQVLLVLERGDKN